MKHIFCSDWGGEFGQNQNTIRFLFNPFLRFHPRYGGTGGVGGRITKILFRGLRLENDLLGLGICEGGLGDLLGLTISGLAGLKKKLPIVIK